MDETLDFCGVSMEVPLPIVPSPTMAKTVTSELVKYLWWRKTRDCFPSPGSKVCAQAQHLHSLRGLQGWMELFKDDWPGLQLTCPRESWFVSTAHSPVQEATSPRQGLRQPLRPSSHKKKPPAHVLLPGLLSQDFFPEAAGFE